MSQAPDPFHPGATILERLVIGYAGFILGVITLPLGYSISMHEEVLLADVLASFPFSSAPPSAWTYILEVPYLFLVLGIIQFSLLAGPFYFVGGLIGSLSWPKSLYITLPTALLLSYSLLGQLEYLALDCPIWQIILMAFTPSLLVLAVWYGSGYAIRRLIWLSLWSRDSPRP